MHTDHQVTCVYKYVYIDIQSSSCLEALRSLLNTEGILTLPKFLLSDGSLIQM